jgi:chemotaxis protein MotB
MARKKRIEEHVNHERWLVSYADFITLLFAFFVVMYSISSVNEGKYRVLSDTLEAVFTDPARSKEPIQVGELLRGEGKQTPEPKTIETPLNVLELPAIEMPIPPPIDALSTEQQLDKYSSTSADEETLRTIKDISKQLNKVLADLIANDDVIIKQGDDWLELEMKSNVLFYSGESRLETTAVSIIGKVANILSTSANPIQVEGFTDNNPINTPKFPSNWELSAARAASVVHLLDRYGLDPSRMSAIGYGEFKPIADNSTEQGRQKNRRVVLVVLGNKDSRRDINVFNPDTTTTPSQSTSPTQNSAPVNAEPTSTNTP